MPFAALVVVLFLMSVSSVVVVKTEAGRSAYMTTGDYNNTGNSLTKLSRNTLRYGGYEEDTLSSTLKQDRDTVQGTLLRACRTIHTLSLLNNCTNPYDEATVWAFIGPPNTIGLLSVAWNGTTTNTFTCANSAQYGRGLIQKAIPKIFIEDGDFLYDFSDMGIIGSNDPCGYSEIVGR